MRDDDELDRPIDDVALADVIAEDRQAIAPVDDDLVIANVGNSGITGAHIEEVDRKGDLARNRW
jgi:hypothetical protein